MNKTKPLPVRPETGCYYELPRDTSTAQMKSYQKWAESTSGNFVSRTGRRLFFNFTCPRDRDQFLAALEKSLIETGCIVSRTFLPP